MSLFGFVLFKHYQTLYSQPIRLLIAHHLFSMNASISLALSIATFYLIIKIHLEH